MANSRDPRLPTDFHRGDRRYGDVGGHAPPDDTLENTRDHNRIWFELRNRRNCCCQPGQEGFQYCTGPKADYDAMICDEYLLPAGTLIDYYPGSGGNDGIGWYLTEGCGGGGSTTSEPFSSSTFYPDGSFHNGPMFVVDSRPGNFLGTSASWQDTGWLPNVTWSWEFWIKPSESDLTLAKNLISSGPFMNLADGGLFVNLQADGGLSVAHQTVGTKESPPNCIFPQVWNHVVLVRDAEKEQFQVYLNGVKRTQFKLVNDFAINDDILAAFGTFGGAGVQWSDMARYNGALSAQVIFRHYKSIALDYGLPLPGEDPETDPPGGGGEPGQPGEPTPDVTPYIDNLDPGQISATGTAGYVMMSDSQADSAEWVSPEDSPFELEERKSQPDGYASLDGTTKVPTAELGTGTAAATNFLRGDRSWHTGELIPGPPTALNQMVRAEPASSAEFIATIPLTIGPAGPTHRYPLTDSSPHAGVGSPPWGNLVAGGSPAPTVVDDPNDYIFAGETVVQINGGSSSLAASSVFTTLSELVLAVWVKPQALPAATCNIVRIGVGGMGIRYKTDGKVEGFTPGGVQATSTAAIPIDEWSFIVIANDGAGINTGFRMWINGVAQGAVGAGNFSGSPHQLVVGSDGFEGRIGHIVISADAWAGGNITDAEVLSLYETRRPTWTIVSTALSGIDVSREGAVQSATLRPEINFVEGAGTALTVTDNPTFNRVDVEIEAEIGMHAEENGTPVTADKRSLIQFVDGVNSTPNIVDVPGDDAIEVAFDITRGIDASEDDTPITADPRPRINFKAGTNVAITVTDDPGDDEVEVEITATSPAGSGIEVSDDGGDVTAAPRGRLTFLEGTNVSLTVTDDGGGDNVNIEIASSGGGGGGGAPEIQYETRSTNTILGVADHAKVIDITASITQTFEADETLDDGWWCILHNKTDDGTTIVTLNPDGSETIDGLTTVTMYSGEMRLIICNGAGGNFNSEMLKGGFARFTADGSFIVPHGCKSFTVDAIGGGGGGGGGRGAASGTRNGGTGGGGGGRRKDTFPASLLGAAGSSISVDVGAGGAAGTGGNNANGTDGSPGDPTTFGTIVTAYGGGGGKQGSNTGWGVGGGGGGDGEVGQIGQQLGSAAGGARGGGGQVGPGYGGAGGGASPATVAGFAWGMPAAWGGGGGGGTTGGATGPGGNSVFGGGGGGAGGGQNGATPNTGGTAGGVNTYGTGGGPAGGTGGSGGAGTAGTAGDLRICGTGGSGGGSHSAGTAGVGGAGGTIGGGGGGGGGGTSIGNSGGVGGRGECRVWYN